MQKRPDNESRRWNELLAVFSCPEACRTCSDCCPICGVRLCGSGRGPGVFVHAAERCCGGSIGDDRYEERIGTWPFCGNRRLRETHFALCILWFYAIFRLSQPTSDRRHRRSRWRTLVEISGDCRQQEYHTSDPSNLFWFKPIQELGNALE